MPNPLLDGLLRVLRQVGTRALHRYTTPTRQDRQDREDTRDGAPRARFKTRQEEPKPKPSSQRRGPQPKQQRRRQEMPEATADYPGDYRRLPEIVYDPHPDGRPDPGEIVWTWVPYDEDYSQGKDRPVLLIGRDNGWLLGLQITSQDHDRDAAQEARHNRYWVDIGSGEWDNQRRPSEVRVNRIIRVNPHAVRRVGAILNQRVFDMVADEVALHY